MQALAPPRGDAGSSPPTPTESRPPGAPRILVIEADRPLRELLTTVLSDEGYDVAAAAAGDPGSAEAATALPDLVLFDPRRTRTGVPAAGVPAAGVPGRGAKGPPVPLLVLSASPEAERLAGAAALGAAGSLPLPFDLDDLLDTVGRLAAPARAPVPEHLAAPPAGAGEAARRRSLLRLAQDVAAARAAVVAVRAETRALAEREAAGRAAGRVLPPQDRRRLRALRLEAEALRLRLDAYRAEFERLRAAAPRPCGAAAPAAGGRAGSPA